MSIKHQSFMVPGAGSHISVTGNFDVNDFGTIASPIAIPGTSTLTQLTNDGLGPQTSNVNAPDGVTELWDVANDEFDFSQLKMGDQILIRTVVEVTILSVNTDVSSDLVAGIGVAEFSLPWVRASFKATGVYELSRTSFITMDSVAALTGKAQFKMMADKVCNATVIGWNYIVNLRS
jgi:hypothetical protein